MTHMGGDWRWCYVVYKIGWNVVSRVSCKVAAVLSGSSEWCESGVVGGGATWQSRTPPPSLQSTPPPLYPPSLHKSTLSATGHRWPGQAAKSSHLVLYS